MRISKTKLYEMIENDVGIFKKVAEYDSYEQYEYVIQYSTFIKVIFYINFPYRITSKNFIASTVRIKVQKYFLFTEEYSLSEIFGLLSNQTKFIRDFFDNKKERMNEIIRSERKKERQNILSNTWSE